MGRYMFCEGLNIEKIYYLLDQIDMVTERTIKKSYAEQGSKHVAGAGS